MRTLSAAARTFLDPTTGAPAFGSYEGPLPAIDLGGPSLVARVIRRKKWVYLAISADRVWVSLAIVRMGYAATAFAFVYDLKMRRMLADRSVVGPPRAAEVADDPHAPGVLARFGFGRSSVAIERRAGALAVRARFGALALDADLDAESAPPAVSAIASLGPELASATEKRALAPVRGSLLVAGERLSLDGGVGGYDYSHGLMPRHTRWRWAFAMGRARDGSPLAFNLVEGFVGEAECAVFHAGKVHPLGEPRIAFDVDNPDRAWKLVGDGIDLTFEPGAVHAQRTNLVLVRSTFLQPAGLFRGTLRIGGHDVAVDDVPGVVEDQDLFW